MAVAVELVAVEGGAEGAAGVGVGTEVEERETWTSQPINWTRNWRTTMPQPCKLKHEPPRSNSDELCIGNYESFSTNCVFVGQ